MSAFLYYVAVLSSFHLTVLSTWSEIYKYVGVSIVVGHYCDMTGLVLLTKLAQSIKLASEIIILLTSYQSFACNACQCCMSMILLISCSLASSLLWCA